MRYVRFFQKYAAIMIGYDTKFSHFPHKIINLVLRGKLYAFFAKERILMGFDLNKALAKHGG